MKLKKNYLIYIIVLFSLSYALQLIIFFTGGIESKNFRSFALILMWFPALTAVGFRILTKEGFKNVGWGLSKWWLSIIAIFTPLLVVFLSSGIIVIFNWGVISENLFQFKDGIVIIGNEVGLLLGIHPQKIGYFVLNIIITIIFGALFGMIYTFGEEFGWRGYLQGKLLNKFGINKGFLLTGLIWGFWHIPIILMGYNFPDNPILGAFVLMPLSTIFMGLFEGFLYLKSKSIWMPTLAHAAINITAGLFFEGIEMLTNELLRHVIWLFIWGIVAGGSLYLIHHTKDHLFECENKQIESEEFVLES
ncbi:MAG: CPBP family intramembrane metalloprotease [Candidatus Lokiarchaeota archaeon]|nr:CPBP family intramembrane metalloprotease [Candidatus Harpocratesius repetitus]